MTQVKLATTRVESSEVGEAYSLSERKTEELVLGLVGAVGSGVSTTSNILKEKLEKLYGYNVVIVRVSRLVNDIAKEKFNCDFVSDDDPERIEKLQRYGNQIREKLGPEYISKSIVRMIYDGRGDKVIGETRRYCTIIDSLKNPSEVSLLREVYGSSFWLFSVFSPEEKRISRLEGLGVDSVNIQKIRIADYHDGLKHGQSVKNTILSADIFLRNDGDNTELLEKSVNRFLNVMFGVGVNTPTQDESAMLAAAGAGRRSACLSRQVGASIVSESGELIGQGANDVPMFGGGAYRYESQDGDHRCYKWKGKKCHNDDRKEVLYTEILRSVSAIEEIKGNSGLLEKIENVVRNSKIRDLIEFSRAVHAEMDAIVSVARTGGRSLKGSVLYSTTYPCHNCARHIVASGITRVVYIEPYPKSLATELHDDSISNDSRMGGERVVFLQYEGVSPRSFPRVFGHDSDRKVNGKLIEHIETEAVPICSSPMDSLVAREELAIKDVLKGETG